MTDLLSALKGRKPEEIRAIVNDLPDAVVQSLLSDLGGTRSRTPANPLAQALELDDGYVPREHLAYLSDRLAQAANDVEHGQSRRLIVSMPPRMGKSSLGSVYTPVWLLRRNPAWKIGLISHDPTLATLWGRAIRNTIEEHGDLLGIGIAPDAGAASEWQTTERGGVISRSAPGQSVTGRGFKVMLVDDIVRDYAAAHSEAQRQAVWDWWTANALTRLEPPSLVIVIGTRWHEDDFIGRLMSDEYEGDPASWEVVTFPALAETDDVLGRHPGDPLLTPLNRAETPEEALARWEEMRLSVGGYNWASQFQQRPAPAEGAIFNMGWFRYWTTDPSRATEDGTVRLVDFDSMVGARWLDSWDCAFKGTDDSDFVVGQRWCRHGGNRFLVDQRRGRWTFTQTIAQMEAWAEPFGYGRHVHERLIEDKANGPAIIDTLRDKISGLKPIQVAIGKEGRVRAITPECESGNVYLPHPAEYPWVADLLSELRGFPTAAHDDQVDALSQALNELREAGRAMITVPGDRPAPQLVSRAQAYRTGLRRGTNGR